MPYNPRNDTTRIVGEAADDALIGAVHRPYNERGRRAETVRARLKRELFALVNEAVDKATADMPHCDSSVPRHAVAALPVGVPEQDEEEFDEQDIQEGVDLPICDEEACLVEVCPFGPGAAALTDEELLEAMTSCELSPYRVERTRTDVVSIADVLEGAGWPVYRDYQQAEAVEVVEKMDAGWTEYLCDCVEILRALADGRYQEVQDDEPDDEWCGPEPEPYEECARPYVPWLRS